MKSWKWDPYDGISALLRRERETNAHSHILFLSLPLFLPPSLLPHPVPLGLAQAPQYLRLQSTRLPCSSVWSMRKIHPFLPLMRMSLVTLPWWQREPSWVEGEGVSSAVSASCSTWSPVSCGPITVVLPSFCVQLSSAAVPKGWQQLLAMKPFSWWSCPPHPHISALWNHFKALGLGCTALSLSVPPERSSQQGPHANPIATALGWLSLSACAQKIPPAHNMID